MTSYALPQNDKDQRRKSELLSQRSRFGFDNTYGFPIAEKYYPEDDSNLQWTLSVLKSAYKIRSNTEAIIKNTGWRTEKPIPQVSPVNLAGKLVTKDLVYLLGYYLPDLGPLDNGGRPSSLEEYQAVFAKVRKTYSSETFMEDSYFSYSFLAGPNPNMFSCMTQMPINMPFKDEDFQKNSAFGGDTLQTALAERRLFISDYKALKDMVSGVHPKQKKYIYAPIVIFARPRGGSSFLPVAIQCGQDPAQHIVITPADSWAWQMAKATAWVAHYCYHEMVAHLGCTHLLIEPLVVTTKRQLHKSHPISALITPHFEGTMPITSLAVKKLIQDGQPVDRLVGSNQQSNYAFIAKERLAYSFTDNYLPNSLQKRGVLSNKDLPVYHYRDDGLPIWNSIHKFVSQYVDYYYADDAAIRADFELQAWALEAGAATGGAVKDFAGNGGVKDKTQLIDTCTMIIFTSGPQHAAVNFPQLSDMSFIPGAPLAGYRKAPESRVMTKQDYLDILPPFDVALVQWQTTYLLGSVYHTQLGQYNFGQFTDAKIVQSVQAFQGDLKSIESDIQTRNKSRTPYEHLLPSKIPQSINV